MIARGLALASLALAAAAYVSHGGAARVDLAGPTWVAEDIGGRGVIDDLQSHVTFSIDGGVQGDGGCNGFFGNYRLENGVLVLEPLGSTRRACPPAVMDQEQRFFEALASVRGYRIENGLLHLVDADDETVIRLWRRE